MDNTGFCKLRESFSVWKKIVSFFFRIGDEGVIIIEEMRVCGVVVEMG